MKSECGAQSQHGSRLLPDDTTTTTTTTSQLVESRDATPEISARKNLEIRRRNSHGTFTISLSELSNQELREMLVQLSDGVEAERQEGEKLKSLLSKAEQENINKGRRIVSLRQQLQAWPARLTSEVQSRDAEIKNLKATNDQLSAEQELLRGRIERLEQQRIEDAQHITKAAEVNESKQQQIDDLMLLNEDLQDQLSRGEAKKRPSVVVPGIPLPPKEPPVCVQCNQMRKFADQFPWGVFENNWRDFDRLFRFMKVLATDSPPTEEMKSKPPSPTTPSVTVLEVDSTPRPVQRNTGYAQASSTTAATCSTSADDGLEPGEILDPSVKTVKRRGRRKKKSTTAEASESRGLKRPPAVDISDLESDIMASLQTA